MSTKLSQTLSSGAPVFVVGKNETTYEGNIPSWWDLHSKQVMLGGLAIVGAIVLINLSKGKRTAAQGGVKE